MIRFAQVKYSYGPQGRGFALGPVNLEIPPGQIVVWAGHNGSGKSTAARLLTREIMPHAGEVLRPAGAAFYYCQQSAENAFVELTLGQHFRALGGSGPKSFEVAQKRFPELVELQHRYVDELSGGQQQLFTFALAISRGFVILVLDEVVNHLDRAIRLRVLEAAKQFVDDGQDRYCIVISHDLDVARAAARVHLFREGQVIADVRGDGIDSALSRAGGLA